MERHVLARPRDERRLAMMNDWMRYDRNGEYQTLILDF